MLLNESYENSQKAREQSVLCPCGHRNYIDNKKEFKICQFCGRKHFSKRAKFKKNLKEIMELKK